MNTTAAAFLADIIARPDDDTPRLIYADWLEEQGEAERAEFIRVQCKLACHSGPCASPRWAALAMRNSELLQLAGGWTDGLPERLEGSGKIWLNDFITWRRGLIAELICPIWQWNDDRLEINGPTMHVHGIRLGAHAVLKHHPVEKLTLTDIHDISKLTIQGSIAESSVRKLILELNGSFIVTIVDGMPFTPQRLGEVLSRALPDVMIEIRFSDSPIQMEPGFL